MCPAWVVRELGYCCSRKHYIWSCAHCGICYNFLTLFPFPFLFLSPPVELLSYIYLFHQNFLTHMHSFYFLHSLVHSLLDFLFDKHSLKAMHLFTIKTLPSRILVP